jgi:iron complex transport system substrate-binding protein
MLFSRAKNVTSEALASATRGFGLLLACALGLVLSGACARDGVASAPSESPKTARRVVALAPSLAEIAALLLEEEKSRLVGVSRHSDFPEFVSHLPDVGPFHRFNVETVVSLKPDLVLATQDGNPRDQVLRLRERGLPVVVVSTPDLRAVGESIRQVGKALGRVESADRMARALEASLEAFKKRAPAGRKPRVMLQLGDDPVVVAGGQGILNELLTLAGGANAFQDVPHAYPRPSLEELYRRDPEVVVVLGMSEESSRLEQIANRWRGQKKLSAARAGRIHVLRGDELFRPTPRLVQGLARLEGVLHEK